METLGFGGGCHWCTEAVFQSLKGVHQVSQGFIRSDPPNESWSEAVEVTFDPSIITRKDLVAVHLATHASTSNHTMREKYRSAVYALDASEQEDLEVAIKTFERESEVAFVTCVLTHRGFKSSDERFQNYYASGPERPFCQTYIDPKLAKLRTKFSTLLIDSSDS